jgi:hypothetical protein
MIKRLLLGFLLGTAIGNLIAWFFGSYVSSVLVARMGSVPVAILVQSLVSGLYGSFALAGTLFYDIEQWSLTRSSVMHFLVIVVLYVPAAMFLGWADSATEILIVEGILLVAYFIIWLVIYLRYKREVRSLNEMLNKRFWQKEERL